MQVRLEVAHQKANVKRVVLKHDAVIGRSAECSLRIASSLVSRQHCRFTIGDSQVLIRDLGSSNGTFLNGKKLTPEKDYPVTPDSQLSVGGVNFYVRFEAPRPVPGAPPGSTVDLPRVKANEEKESLTAEWTGPAIGAAAVAGNVAAAFATSGAAAAEPEVPEAAVPETAAAESSVPDSENAAAAAAAWVPPAEAAPDSAVLAEPVAAAGPVESDTNAFLEGSLEASLDSPADTELPTTSADLSDDVPVADPVMPIFMPPEVAAREMVDAAPGDDLDSFANELPGTLDEIPAFNPSAPAIKAAAVDSADDEAGRPESASPKSKRGVFSLFGLFRGKKKSKESASPRELPTPQEVVPAATEVPEDTLPIGSEVEVNPEDTSAPDDTATIMEPVVAEAVPVAPPVPVPEPGASEDDVMSFLASEQTNEPEEQADAGFGDFLKRLDR